MPIPLGVLAVAGAAGAAGNAYELLESQVLSSNQASVTFSGLAAYAANYRHLQIRYVARDNRSSFVGSNIQLRFNGDTGANYANHLLYGDGGGVGALATVNASQLRLGDITGGNATTGNFAPGVSDILDAYQSKNKTIRTFSGLTEYNWIELSSGLWRNTTGVTSITLFTLLGTALVTGSRFSLYGLRSA